MKAKTKLQQRVMAVSQSLPPLTPQQEAWGYERCLEHIGRKLRSGAITCLDCGHTWQDAQPPLLTTEGGCTCPACGRKLKVSETKRQKFTEKEYLMVAATRGGFQVLRFFLLELYCRVGSPAFRSCREVAQLYITPDGRSTAVSKLRARSMYYDLWVHGSAMEVRQLGSAHNISPSGVCPGGRYLPELRRNGFRGSFHGLTPLTMLTLLLGNPKAETLLKAGQIALLKRVAQHSGCELNEHWPSVKICLRNGYLVKDAGLWHDYIAMLARAGKDVRSAKYACPADLKGEHDRLSEREHRRQQRERLEKQRRESQEEEEAYQREKGRFFGVALTDGELTVAVLKSVQEFMEEGDTLKHCVFANAYYKKKDSLILSATVYGQRVETVEVSLKAMKVVQCRGKNNRRTKYHRRIVELVTGNMKVIRRAMKRAA